MKLKTSPRKPKTKRPAAASTRFRDEDWDLIDRLRADTGIESLTDLLRLALRALGRERGL